MILDWRNADEIRAISKNDALITWEDHQKWYRKIKDSQATEVWVYEAEGRALGSVTLFDIDREKRHCHWGFYIGERSSPEGSGTRMCEEALNYIFGPLEMNVVHAEVLSNNASSIGFHQKLGFRETSREKNWAMREGQVMDLISMEQTKEEWLARKPS